MHRRTLLRGSLLGGVGLAAAALIGCGGDDDDAASTGTTTQSSTGSTTAASSGSSSTTTTSSDDSASDDSSGDPPAAVGTLVQDPDLAYPYQFPEPAKTPKPGGTLRVAVTFDVANFDPTVSSAGGTITVPNMVYNRLLGFVGGPNYDPVQARTRARARLGLGTARRMARRSRSRSATTSTGRTSRR